jgi:hypothetical protein
MKSSFDPVKPGIRSAVPTVVDVGSASTAASSPRGVDRRIGRATSGRSTNGGVLTERDGSGRWSYGR